ncbi:MAG TPA: FAD-dependent oxidoreductase [Candidatus Nitrosopolaris sp.]|nr:FAD-dependent oxidoreductase [Candidatus Nitrosopolaris sp.]
MAAPELTARLERVVEHGAETRSFFLRLAAPLAFRPGQFISCLLPVAGERLIRPYSMASSPEEADCLELLVDRVPGGPGSHYLFTLAVGATIHFTGPWGTFILDQAPAAEAVFIADGTGIAPIRPMLHRALAGTPTHALRLLHAGTGGSTPLFREEVLRLARSEPGFTVDYTDSRVLLDEVRRRWVESDADRSRHFFICGVGAIVPTLRDMLRQAGYARRAVQYEKW